MKQLHIRFKLLVLALACVFLMTGCTVRVAYGMLDTIMGWQLGQYVTLKGEEKKFMKHTFDEFHDWHRSTQLSLYIDYLKQLKQGMITKPITAEYLHAESDKLQDLLDSSVGYLVPGLTQVAMGLNNEQIRRINDITRYIGGFFGSFTDEQKQALIKWETNLVPHEELMIKQQEIWQQEFLNAMTFQDSQAELQTRIQALMLVRTDNWDPELQRVLDLNQRATFEMLAELFNSQTPKQRKKLERKFDQYINDFTILAAKAH